MFELIKNIHIVISILITIPISSCSNEKVVSKDKNDFLDNFISLNSEDCNCYQVDFDKLRINVKICTKSKIDSVYKYLYINSYSCGSKRVKVLSLESNTTFFPDTLPQIYTSKYEREETIEIIEETFCNLDGSIIDYIKMVYGGENGIKHTQLNEKWDAYSVFLSFEKDDYVLNENTTFLTDGEVIFLIKYKSSTLSKKEIDNEIEFILKNSIIESD